LSPPQPLLVLHWQALSTLSIELRERVEPNHSPLSRRHRFLPTRMVQRALHDMSKLTSAVGNAAVYYTVLLIPLAVLGTLLFVVFGKSMKTTCQSWHTTRCDIPVSNTVYG
jgi:hypothetical protein